MSTKEIKVYSTPGCPWCRRVKKFLRTMVSSIKISMWLKIERPATR